MDDLLAVDQNSSPLTIKHIRILRLVRRSGGVAVKLPLRFKFETEAVNALCDEGSLSAAPQVGPVCRAIRFR